METILAEYDGKVFVPCEPVQLPVGTKVLVSKVWPPGIQTPEQKAEWEELKKQIESTDPYFSTVDEAMRYAKKRP
jgi:hypothetical protein